MRKELDTKQVQEISLNILYRVTQLCEKLNLKYFLMYGTLIGAIRHHGFIPWDDDVDIMMPRPDYDCLLNYLENNKLSNLTVFNNNTHEDYPYMITRISDDRYQIEADNEKSIGMGVFIDIYPFDGLGNTEKEAIKYGLQGDRLSSFCYQATRKRFSMVNTSSTFKRFLKLPVYIISKLIGKRYFQNRILFLNGKYEYYKSNYVGCFVWLSGGFRDIFRREWFDDYEMCQFEQYSFRVPKQYDSVLKHAYGDYMTLPPEGERIGHHYYKAYKKPGY